MRISLKLLGLSEAALLIAVVAVLVPVRILMEKQIVRQIQGELESIAMNAAPLLDGDLHRALETPGPESDAAFASLRATLTEVRDRNELEAEHIYTFYPYEDHVRFGVMTQDPFRGAVYVRQPGMDHVFEEGAVVSTELYRDDHGEWISAYAPIRSSDGAIVGLLEVDRSAEQYFERWCSTPS
jgi:methyl-accepting chemotaxis protein